MNQKEGTPLENKGLYIPANIRPRFEFFEGFGVPELVATVIAALISGFIAFLIHTFTDGMILPILCVLVTVAASVTAQMKDASNQSAIDQVKYVLWFIKEQKVYPYYYSNTFTLKSRKGRSNAYISKKEKERSGRPAKKSAYNDRERIY